MLLEQRALMEAQLLEARDVAIKAKFIPLIAQWYDHLNDNQRDGNRDRMIKREIERIRLDVNSDDYHEIDPNADDIAKSWGRERVFSMDLWNRALAEKTIDTIMAADPDRTKSFSTWMCIRFLKDELRLEDLPRFTDALELFGELVRRKKLPVEQRDVNRYPDIQSVMDVIAPFKEEAVAEQNAAYEAEMLKQSVVYADNDLYIFLSPRTEEAAQWFGRDTEWCTAWGGKYGRHPTRGGLYHNYANESPLFILRDKTDEKHRYQLHFTSRQFMDVQDRAIDVRKLSQVYRGLDDVMKLAATREIEGDFRVGPYVAIPTTTESGYYVEMKMVGPLETMSGVDSLNLVFGKTGGITLRGKDAKTKRLIFVGVLPDSIAKHPEIRSHVIETLNAFGFRGDCSTAVDSGIAFNPQTKKYHLAQKAASLSLSHKTQWKKYTLPDQLRYILFDGDKRVVRLDVHETTGEWNPSVIRLEEFQKGYEKELFTILKALANRRSIGLSQDHDIVGYLSQDDMKVILKLRPDWGSSKDRYDAFGDSRALRRRVIAELEEHTNTDASFIGDKVVVDRWKNVEALFDEIGSEYAENLMKYVQGNRHLDYYGDYDLDDDMKRELLQGLDPETLGQLFEWIKKEYEGEEGMEDIDLDDPIEAIIDIDEEFDCDELRSAYRQARASGDESGSLGEMTRALRNSVEREDNLWFVKNDKIVDDFTWDGEIVLAVPLPDLLKLYRGESQLYDIANEGWHATLLEKGTVGPHYEDDYSGYDDEAAKDSFEDAVTNFLP